MILFTLVESMARTTPPTVTREEKEMFCNIGMLVRKALFAVGVPESGVTENKGHVVHDVLKK